MNSTQFLSELSKFSADMKLAESKVYFDTMTVENDRIIFDNRGDQPAITVQEAIDLLTQHASKTVWFMSYCSCSEFPACYIKKADFEGESYIRISGEW